VSRIPTFVTSVLRKQSRSYGSNIETILDHALVNVATFQRHGIAATAKHWPGEGYDDRDQHLVGTLNPLDEPAWRASFGRLYRGLIDAGVMTVMSAHIAWPAYARRHGVEGLESCRPASVSRLLNQTLLRGELGFNGLIVSDAIGMAGLGSWAALLAQKQDLYVKVPAVVGHAQPVSNPDFARGLGRLPAGLNPAEFTGSRRQCSRFEESGGPQPLVHSHREHDLRVNSCFVVNG